LSILAMRGEEANSSNLTPWWREKCLHASPTLIPMVYLLIHPSG
jgi:hypothetical protein